MYVELDDCRAVPQLINANMTPSSFVPIASIRSIPLGEDEMLITHEVPTNVVPILIQEERSESI